jgi:hypothetical protein
MMLRQNKLVFVLAKFVVARLSVGYFKVLHSSSQQTYSKVFFQPS